MSSRRHPQRKDALSDNVAVTWERRVDDTLFDELARLIEEEARRQDAEREDGQRRRPSPDQEHGRRPA